MRQNNYIKTNKKKQLQNPVLYKSSKIIHNLNNLKQLKKIIKNSLKYKYFCVWKATELTTKPVATHFNRGLQTSNCKIAARLTCLICSFKNNWYCVFILALGLLPIFLDKDFWQICSNNWAKTKISHYKVNSIVII